MTLRHIAEKNVRRGTTLVPIDGTGAAVLLSKKKKFLLVKISKSFVKIKNKNDHRS